MLTLLAPSSPIKAKLAARKLRKAVKAGAACLGIDIFNGNSDGYNFATAKAEGVTFVIHKMSQGWTDANGTARGPAANNGPGGWMDWKVWGALNRARACGIPVVGGYHWLLRGNGVWQARLFYNAMVACGGPHGMIAAVDVERNDWNQALNADAQTLRDFIGEWHRLSGGQPVWIYSAEWYWGPYMGEPRDLAANPLWVAQYFQRGYPVGLSAAVADVTPGYFSPFGGWGAYVARQWSSNVLVSGNQSDVDYFPGTLAQLQAWTVPSGVKPPKPVTPAHPPAHVNVVMLQNAVHAAPDGQWGPDTDRRCELVRHKGPTAGLQQALGCRADGIWGPQTQLAYLTAVKGVQAALGVGVDGVWGPATDQAYLNASPMR